MSLDWNTERLNPEAKAKWFPADEHGKMNDNLHVLIFTTMAVDIGDITEKNYLEFTDRMNRWVAQVGPLFQRLDKDTQEWVPLIPTVDHVRAAIGLHTNVGFMPRAEWTRKLRTAVADKAEAKFNAANSA